MLLVTSSKSFFFYNASENTESELAEKPKKKTETGDFENTKRRTKTEPKLNFEHIKRTTQMVKLVQVSLHS